MRNTDTNSMLMHGYRNLTSALVNEKWEPVADTDEFSNNLVYFGVISYRTVQKKEGIRRASAQPSAIQLSIPCVS